MSIEAQFEVGLRHIFLQQVKLYNDTLAHNEISSMIIDTNIQELGVNLTILIDTLFPLFDELKNDYLKQEVKLMDSITIVLEQLVTFKEKHGNKTNESNALYTSAFERMTLDLMRSENNLLNFINTTTTELSFFQNMEHKRSQISDRYFIKLALGLICLSSIIVTCLIFLMGGIFCYCSKHAKQTTTTNSQSTCIQGKNRAASVLTTNSENRVDSVLTNRADSILSEHDETRANSVLSRNDENRTETERTRNRSIDSSIMAAQPSIASFEDVPLNENRTLKSSLEHDSVFKSLLCCTSCKNSNPDVSFPLKEFANQDRTVY